MGNLNDERVVFHESHNPLQNSIEQLIRRSSCIISSEQAKSVIWSFIGSVLPRRGACSNASKTPQMSKNRVAQSEMTLVKTSTS